MKKFGTLPEMPDTDVLWRDGADQYGDAWFERAYSAEAMRDYAKMAVKEEQERIALWLSKQRNDIPATGEEFANALRYAIKHDIAIQ